MNAGRIAVSGPPCPTIAPGIDATPGYPVELGQAFAAGFPPAWALPAAPDTAVCLVEATQWQPWLEQAACLLDATETARVRRLRFVADREMRTIAYALHRLLLARLFGRDPREVPLYRDDRGCPRLAGRLGFTSLSHADGLIALAVNAGGAVGIDIERRHRARELPAIADRICHPEEVAAIAAVDPAEQCAALLRLWVRKEALLKAAGLGLAVEMTSFRASNSGLASSSGAIGVQTLDVGDAAVAALAGPAGTRAEVHWLRPCRTN